IYAPKAPHRHDPAAAPRKQVRPRSVGLHAPFNEEIRHTVEIRERTLICGGLAAGRIVARTKIDVLIEPTVLRPELWAAPDQLRVPAAVIGKVIGGIGEHLPERRAARRREE